MFTTDPSRKTIDVLDLHSPSAVYGVGLLFKNLTVNREFVENALVCPVSAFDECYFVWDKQTKDLEKQNKTSFSSNRMPGNEAVEEKGSSL